MNLPQLQQAEDTGGIDRKIVIIGTSVFLNRKVLRELVSAGIECVAIEDVITSVRTLGDSFFEDRNLVFVEVTTSEQDVKIRDLRPPFEYVTHMRFVADMSTRFGFAAYLYTHDGTVVEMVEAFRKFQSGESLFETQKYELLASTLTNTQLEAQVTELELRVPQLETQLATAQADLLASATRYDALASDNLALSGRVTDLETTNATLQSDLTAATERATSAEAQVISLTSQVADLEAQVAELQAQINTPSVP